jgi:hypothetical protein
MATPFGSWNLYTDVSFCIQRLEDTYRTTHQTQVQCQHLPTPARSTKRFLTHPTTDRTPAGLSVPSEEPLLRSLFVVNGEALHECVSLRPRSALFFVQTRITDPSFTQSTLQVGASENKQKHVVGSSTGQRANSHLSQLRHLASRNGILLSPTQNYTPRSCLTMPRWIRCKYQTSQP